MGLLRCRPIRPSADRLMGSSSFEPTHGLAEGVEVVANLGGDGALADARARGQGDQLAQAQARGDLWWRPSRGSRKEGTSVSSLTRSHSSSPLMMPSGR